MQLNIILGSLLLMAACLGPNESPFVGDYSCNSTTSYSFTQPPNTPGLIQDQTATAYIRQFGDDKLEVELTTTAMRPTCPTLRYSARDLTATLDSGQSCSVSNSEGNFTIVLDAGDLRLLADQLSGGSTGSVSGTWLTSGGPAPVRGSLVQSKTCTRI